MTDPDENLVDQLKRLGEDMGRDFLEFSNEQLPDTLERRAQFRSGLADEWSNGWNLFEAVNRAMQEAAVLLLERCEETKGSPDERSDTRECLTLIHSNACLILQEVFTLLRAGFWGGGAARWRALHELTVTAYLLSTNGPSIARRYLAHGEVVQTRRLGTAFDRYGKGPIPAQEMEQRKERAAELCRLHEVSESGYKFQGAYGWALPLMPMEKSGKLTRPTFDKLEALAKQSDWRELVGTAHGLVHADSAGVVTAVISKDNEYILGAVPLFISTVARPTMLSVQRLAAATCVGFESEVSDFTEKIQTFGSAVMALAGWAADAFPMSESSEQLARGSRPARAGHY